MRYAAEGRYQVSSRETRALHVHPVMALIRFLSKTFGPHCIYDTARLELPEKRTKGNRKRLL